MFEKSSRLADLFLCAVLLFTSGLSLADIPRVAAASSLNFALTEIAERFQQSYGERIELIFGSSRGIARQIQQGAPYDVFLSADSESIDLLRESMVFPIEPLVYGRGRLVVYTLNGSEFNLDGNLRFFAMPVKSTTRRYAIANPETAPYGRIARQALMAMNFWQQTKERFVIGQNALQTAQFAASGNVDAALIPYAIAINPTFSNAGRYVLVAPQLYEPLSHEAVLIPGAGKKAVIFFEYLQSDAAKSVFQASGL